MLQQDPKPDQLLVRIVFRSSRRSVLHEERLAVPAIFSFEDFQNIIEMVQQRSLANVVYGEEYFFYLRRGSMVPINRNNFRALVRERVQALRRNHLANKTALLFEVCCFPIAPEVCIQRGPLDQPDGQATQENPNEQPAGAAALSHGQPFEDLIQEASDDFQREYEKLRVLEFVSLKEEQPGTLSLRLRVNAAVYYELAGAEAAQVAARPVFTVRARRRLSLEDFKRSLQK